MCFFGYKTSPPWAVTRIFANDVGQLASECWLKAVAEGSSPLCLVAGRTLAERFATILLPNSAGRHSTGRNDNGRSGEFLLIVQYGAGQNKTGRNGRGRISSAVHSTALPPLRGARGDISLIGRVFYTKASGRDKLADWTAAQSGQNPCRGRDPSIGSGSVPVFLAGIGRRGERPFGWGVPWQGGFQPP